MQLKLYGREDIDLLEELGPEPQWPPPEENERPVVRYRAQLRQTGSAVVVRRFPCADQRFSAAVAISKKIWSVLPGSLVTLSFIVLR